MARWRLGSLNHCHSKRALFAGLFLLLLAYVSFHGIGPIVLKASNAPPTSIPAKVRNFLVGNIFDFSKIDNITGSPDLIVPNIVHYIKFGSLELSFHELISMLSVWLHHHPEKIMIHCSECINNATLHGKYWDMLNERQPVIEVSYFKEPTHVYGKPFSSAYHVSDVSRILILMKYGGIFLDGDTYVVQSLDRFRHFELALGWPMGQFLGTQVLVAHKNARFLRLWLYSYHWYNASLWYYNAGELPTTSILYDQPELVHRVPVLFGVHYLVNELYKKNWPTWKEFYAIHLLIRHRSYLDNKSNIKTFDEENIKTYDYTFGQMARLLLYNTTELIK